MESTKQALFWAASMADAALEQHTNAEQCGIVPIAKLIRTVEMLCECDIDIKRVPFSKVRTLKPTDHGLVLVNAHRHVDILLNEDDSREDWRFSIVHILGLLLMENSLQDTSNEYIVCENIGYDFSNVVVWDAEPDEHKRQKMRNLFALLVLMPQSSFGAAANSADRISDMAANMGVPRGAINTRMGLTYALKALAIGDIHGQQIQVSIGKE